MPQYRKPPPPTRTVQASVSVSRTGAVRAPLAARAPLRPEIEQPVYHPEYETEEPGYPAEPDEPEAVEPDTVVTVGEEQLARSAEIEAMGVENWKAAHDERNPNQAHRSVQGVRNLEE